MKQRPSGVGHHIDDGIFRAVRFSTLTYILIWFLYFGYTFLFISSLRVSLEDINGCL